MFAIYGSPRRDGNTDTMLDAAIEMIRELPYKTELEAVRAVDLEMLPCAACGECDGTGTCTFEDDMRAIYPRLEAADILMVSTPVHFMGPTAQIKAVIDRCQSVWIQNFVLDPDGFKAGMKEKPRVAGVISACAQEGERMFQGIDNTFLAWFSTLGFHYESKLFVERMDRFGSAKDPKVVERAREFGRGLVEALERRRGWYRH